MDRKTPKAELKIRVEDEARRATRRPKSVTAKTIATAAGAKLRVNALDAASATFGSDFLYVFKSNVRRARKDGRGTK